MPDSGSIGPGLQNGNYPAEVLYGLADSGEQADTASGYVSDAELMAWLETKSDSQYSALRDAMGVSTMRIDLIKSLNDLKTEIGRAVSPEAIEDARQKMLALVDEYKDTPYAKDVADLLNGATAALDHSGDDGFVDDVTRAASDGATLGALSEGITSETDKLGKIDALELVRIGQLVSDAKETTQLASNVMSSRDQTANSIVGNIRG